MSEPEKQLEAVKTSDFAETLVGDNLVCLHQGIELLESLDDAGYVKPCKRCFESTLGGHLRHNTDHYEAFLSGWEAGAIDYDARTRDLRVATERGFAIALLERMEEDLRNLAGVSLGRPVAVKMDAGCVSEWTRSTVGRELQFLLSHTIHHYALMATICQIEGMGTLPLHFGVAPSTVKFQQENG